MANTKKKNEQPDYFANSQSPEAMRKQFITEPALAAIQPGLALGKELLAMMRVLPEAFRQSQERELARLKRQGKDAAPRVEAIQRSMDEADALGELAERGTARAERILASNLQPERCLHGFVSDASGKPRPGLVVHLSAEGKKTRGLPLEAITCDDGYFRIPLPSSGRGAGDKVRHQADLKERLAAAFAALEPGDKAEDASETSKDSILGRVEILSGDRKSIHIDPSPVELAGGSAYREYLIGFDRGKPSRTGPRETAPSPGKSPVSPKAEGGAAKAKAASATPGSKTVREALGTRKSRARKQKK